MSVRVSLPMAVKVVPPPCVVAAQVAAAAIGAGTKVENIQVALQQAVRTRRRHRDTR